MWPIFVIWQVQMTDRCTGHCCAAFPLSYSPDELRENYLCWKEQRFDKKGKDRNGTYFLQDIHLIAPMVRYIGRRTKHPILNIYKAGAMKGSKQHWYTCAHLQDNGDCGTYEYRPKMCRDYPYGNPCQWANYGCTSVKACTVKEDRKEI